MSIGVLTLQILIPGCKSLKEKRSRIKPLLARLHREFNISAAEIGLLDTWNQALLVCALVSNDANHTQRSLAGIAQWVESNWPDVSVADSRIELI